MDMERRSDGTLQAFETRAIHAAYDSKAHQGGICPPVNFSSTFSFEKTADGIDAFSGERQGYIYSRISNPTLDVLERRFASLENASAALASASGMGAIASVFWTFLAAGDEVIADKTLYGCTFSYLAHGLSKFGVKIIFVDFTNPREVKKSISTKAKIVYCETLANPNMRMIDIQKIADITHSINGCRLVVDNTYLTPAIFRPLERGADIVVHSATKYLGGHGDLIAGLTAGSHSDIDQVRMQGLKDLTGAVLSPLNAMLIMRGLKTLSLRVERHSRTAEAIAERLGAHPAVRAVYYPSLKTHPQHDLAVSQMTQFGGVLAFELTDGYEAAINFMDQLKLITRAVSLGDTESLAQHPASMTHSTYTQDERKDHGISEDLIRISLGLEGIEDIWDDIECALR